MAGYKNESLFKEFEIKNISFYNYDPKYKVMTPNSIFKFLKPLKQELDTHGYTVYKTLPTYSFR